MSKLLLDETPLMVLPKLAAKIGLNEAIVLQQIHYWAVKKLNEHEGFYWVYNSYESWREQFPFFSKATIGRSFRNLEDLGLIITGNFNKLSFDKTKWYRIDYAELAKYEDEPCNDGLLKPLVSSEPSMVPNWNDDDTKMEPRTFQNEPTIPETISKTTTETTHKDKKINVDDKSPTTPVRKKGKRVYEEHEEPLILAKYLYELIRRNNEYAKEPNYQTWANDIRLMHESDGIEYSVIKNCISWCQQDSFWSINILSAKKLREKFVTLYGKAQQQKGGRVNGNQPSRREEKQYSADDVRRYFDQTE